MEDCVWGAFTERKLLIKGLEMGGREPTLGSCEQRRGERSRGILRKKTTTTVTVKGFMWGPPRSRQISEWFEGLS
ncbi:hypothetical protein CRG98_012234 [Punica granatum]|uniref:Uncharacterized protein n=1 Tax=Punica granatum TaxID=22663 RepID=A0A2I0KFT4_PUNGR|nr:hypothetical protein CRG98_012234 [Punica granatum]